MQIDIDFDVFKALTARRESEAHTYNAVLRAILLLPHRGELDPIDRVEAAARSGRVVGGRFLPSDTRLRAVYKGRQYLASIIGNEIVVEGGQKFRTASAAAKHVTSTNVNGLTFWEVKRPTDAGWRTIKSLPRDEL